MAVTRMPVFRRLLSYEVNTDKAQISRIGSALVERRMVTRRAHSTDARSAELELAEFGSTTLKGPARTAQGQSAQS